MTGWIMSEHGVPDSYIQVLSPAETPEGNQKHGQFWKCKCLWCNNEFIGWGDAIRSGKRKTCGHHRTNTLDDITGQTFNYLTAIENTKKKGNNNSYIWKCKCKCGKEVEVNRAYLISGSVKSCGCLNQEHGDNIKIDMIGKTFNYLTVLYELPERGVNNKRIYYHCQCKCGNECDVDGISLRNGNTTSCGCYKRKHTSEIKTKNLIGQTFGLLTVIERHSEPSKDGRV